MASRLGQYLDRLKEHPLSRVGPGLITGVADDDPSGIATYSQAGAQFGLNMLWTMPLAFPLMAAIQSMCARIGRVTGKGLAANIKDAFHPIVLPGVVLLLLVANTLNIAADVAAMGEVAELVTGFNRHLMTAFFVFGTLLLQIFIPYHRYVVFLKWLTVSLLAYAAVLFTVHVPWSQVALRTFWPRFTPNADAAAVVVGVFGTTISPYLFFWQASQEVEDMRAGTGVAPLVSEGGASGVELRRIRWDTWSGMLYSDLTAYFIILATAVTLNVAGITNIETAGQAASALRPLAGGFAYMLFAAGILGVGLIGVPVPGRLCRLRYERGNGLEDRPRAQSVGRFRFLRDHSHQRAGRTRHPVFADQSDEGLVLERGDQRGCGRAPHGRHHPAGSQEVGDGLFHRRPGIDHPRLDRDGDHGRSGGWDVHPWVGGPSRFRHPPLRLPRQHGANVQLCP